MVCRDKTAPMSEIFKLSFVCDTIVYVFIFFVSIYLFSEVMV